MPDGMPSPCNSHCDKLLQLTQSFNSAIGDSHLFSPFLIVSAGSWGYWLWVVFMGVAWPLGVVLYGIGADRMGAYGPYVGFPMMLVMAILFGNLAGDLTGEWRGASAGIKRAMLLGVVVLVAAFALFGVAQKWLPQ